MVNYNRPRSWFEVECVVNSVLVGNITKLLSFNSVRKADCFPVLSLKKLWKCFCECPPQGKAINEENAVTHQISSHAKDSFVFTVH